MLVAENKLASTPQKTDVLPAVLWLNKSLNDNLPWSTESLSGTETLPELADAVMVVRRWNRELL